MYDLVKADPRLLFQGSGKKLYLLLGRLIKSGVDVNVVSSCFAEHPNLLSSHRTGCKELRVGKADLCKS
ncbi:hypothetical protein L195_g039264 [Trifolium pratense]|uniref:Uncharacterized protein n=1 Tax=Trifolium pratense TaxID=57577 RepID=A0A2K3LXG2_TRIPR|nr:hypothetical protein L195_g039264 [Trifolium pratense]